MIDQNLITEVENLSLDEQLSLLRILIKSINRSTERDKVLQASVERVRGMLKPTGAMPTDNELREEYTDYLIRKYA